MALLPASFSCESRVSPEVFRATSDQSPGSHCSASVPSEGSHAQSWGPAVVLRAAKRRPPNATMPGTARRDGSSAPSAVESTVTDASAAQVAAEGVAFAQFAHPGAAQGVGEPTERAMPPLLATYSEPLKSRSESIIRTCLPELAGTPAAPTAGRLTPSR